MFFSHDKGIPFVEFGFAHLITLFIFVLGIVLMYVFRDKIRNLTYESKIPIIFGLFILVWEIGLYIFLLTDPQDLGFRDIFPLTSLCGITVYFGVVLGLTKNYRVYEIGFFFTFGAIASLLFPDSGYGYNRYRYYQFIIGHAGFFYMFMYMMFVHNYIPTIKSYWKSVGVLFSITVVYLIINPIFDLNGFFLSDSDGTPFEIFELGSRFIYVLLVILFAIGIMYVWYLLAKLYQKLSKTDDYQKESN